MSKTIVSLLVASILTASTATFAQVYSPVVTNAGQVDTMDLARTAEGIYRTYNAHTDREKAEAIWRFYLTDGRFVAPGMFYHLAGWAYEEPAGQVLDPIKLLNSYGYGLCYQDGPLLEATYQAGGFKDARVWFLTGHTVAEVFYDGHYHYFDSDMLGYNPIGDGPLKQREVASVYQLEHNGNIMLKNLTGPNTSNPNSVDYPWYPADVRAGDMEDIARLFTTTSDNYLYAYQRHPEGHTMDFVLRPGERITRYFHPTPKDLFYLPYAYNGSNWNVLPDLAQFHISIENGPLSEKDKRTWATGKIEYRPAGNGDAAILQHGHDTMITFSMPSPYVIIDANFSLQASLPTTSDRVTAATSTDGGHTWTESSSMAGPFKGSWSLRPASLSAAHQRLNAISGSYGYLLRFSIHRATGRQSTISDFFLTTYFQLNPRTLPTLVPGKNQIEYRAGNQIRDEIPLRVSDYKESASAAKNVEYMSQGGEGYLINSISKGGEVIFDVSAKDGGELSGFDAGARFLDIRQGIAPSKFTAETRKVAPWPANANGPGTASISWATERSGPWIVLWSYDPKLTWLDGQPIQQVLRWPEVDRKLRNLSKGTRHVYVRYQIQGMALDTVRLAAISPIPPTASQHLEIIHVWEENGKQREFHTNIENAEHAQQYEIPIPDGAIVDNVAVVLDCPPDHK